MKRIYIAQRQEPGSERASENARQGFSEKEFDDLIAGLTTQGTLAIPLLYQLRTRSAHTGVTAAI
jgi:hypothetical protein